MHIIRCGEIGVFVFFPAEPDEARTLKRIADSLWTGGILQFHSVDDERFVSPLLFFRFDNGKPFPLYGTTKDDRNEVAAIRNACFLGPGELNFLEKIELMGIPAGIFTIAYCRRCGVGMINTKECTWGICTMCTAFCKHRYILGILHGVKKKGEQWYCSKCGSFRQTDEERFRMQAVMRNYHDQVAQDGISRVDRKFGLTNSRMSSILLQVQKHLEKNKKL